MDNSAARYEYIAQAEPNGSLDVLNKYGITIQGSSITTTDIGNAINEMVADNGEPALIDIMNLHPDKGIIIELFGNNAASCSPTAQSPAGDLGVGVIEIKKPGFFDNTTNVLLFGIGVVVAIAVIKG